MPNKKINIKNILWSALLTILGIVCFPVNPLVLFGLLETTFYPVAYIAGWIFWAIGMGLVMSPIIMFPRRGGVKKGRSFIHTTKLVDTGIYAVVRHPQYLGGILSIFITTILWYPHWLFIVLGIAGIFVVYMGCKEEDQRLVQKFGDAYKIYMKRVPGLNIIAGIFRMNKHRNT